MMLRRLRLIFLPKRERNLRGPFKQCWLTVAIPALWGLSMPFLTLILVALLIPGLSFAAEQPQFTPQAGFGGASEGNGTLTLLLGRTQSFHVASLGTDQSNGSFRLEQRIAFQGKPPQDRVWILIAVSPDRYSGSLSDASGPVTGFTSGSRLSLRYRLKGPLVMHQELQLMPDGKIIDNVGVITVLGIPVGRLRETIKRRSRVP